MERAKLGWSVLALLVVLEAQAAGSGCGPGLGEPYSPLVFMGFACPDRHCGAHKAGFAWADQMELGDAATCETNDDPGFREGCRAFVDDAVTAEQSGFEWALQNEVDNDCLCSGAGPRFEAGCVAYVAAFGP